MPDLTDWARLRAMTEDDIERGALEDPDSVPHLTEDERLAALADLNARTRPRAAE